jgi:cation diffusion facilitator family transporter
MLIGAAVGISVQAVREIVTPHHAPEPYTLIVLLLGVIIKETLFHISSRVSRQIGSTALHADAWHHRSDALTSLFAAIGISVSLLGGEGYEAADDWAALLACGVIAFNGLHFTRRAMAELMDAQPDPQILAGLTAAAESVSGVKAVEKVLARKMGTSYLVDMHIEVDGAMSVRDAHHLAHRVKDEVRRRDTRVDDVLVHIEPHPPLPANP